ncbi:putative iron-sulfur cluster-binding protein [Aspergillus ibericus CBS 121593]|uniref:Iron-sulfur cluster-binding protein n=1 Tax=Aspergillus ibericus CBS 121593 TaxID=1448316 RepID=A0A395H4T8_9EURO|nr:iron-sulfur cluster-binding protein [Aspergillus ibericus CBS 121593]RAL02696.1 iron-sulfur cluster-binding protein [Aspergillus ibericus CBS 121593]
MITERLSSALSSALSASILVALLVGLASLLHALYRSLLDGHKSRLRTESKESNIGPGQGDNENAVSKESDFPQDWWTGSSVFELERRAIFAKKWIYLTHRSRFSKAGDYHSFDVAGIPIFLILGKDGLVRAFHNVCRHRAYTITRKECGSSTVLGCRYHGWSYNTHGQLIKAPHFDSVPGFDKSQNGLFSIHTTTTPTGFIFVNLDASPSVRPVDTSSLDSFARRHGIGGQSTWLGGQTIEGQFNWKLGLRAQRFIDSTKLQHEPPQPKYRFLSSRLFNSPRRCSEDIRVFPFTTFHTLEGAAIWYSLSFVPISAQKTSVRFDLYSHRDMGGPRRSAIQDDLSSRLKTDIQVLEVEFQSYFGSPTLPAVISSASSPDVAGTQKAILDILKRHSKLEKQQGTEVFPATRNSRRNARFEQAEQLCKDLECQDTWNRKSLAW